MKKPTPPKGTIDHELVWSYGDELRVYCRVEENTLQDSKFDEKLKQYRKDLLEYKLGHKIRNLESIIPHDEWEKTH